MKLVSFIFLFNLMLLEAKLNHWKDLPSFSPKTIIDNLFPKDSDVVRVRNPDEVNKTTTLDFVSTTKLSFILLCH